MSPIIIAQDFIFQFNKDITTNDFELKGRVKMIIESKTIAEDIRKINHYGQCETRYQFNEKSFLSEEITYCFNNSDSLIERFGNIYNYNYSGDSIRITVISVPDTVFRIIRHYDTLMRLNFAIAYRDNKLMAKNYFYYDSNGDVKAVKSEDFFHSGVTNKYYSYTYNANKQFTIIEENVVDYKEKHIFSYNKDNRVEKIRTEYNEGDLFDERIYKYDEQGNIISEDFFSVTEYIGYNGEGKLEAYKDTTKSITKYILEYDEKGNWIKKTRISDDTETFTLLRKIEYH